MPTPTSYVLTTENAVPIAFPGLTGAGAVAISPGNFTPTNNAAVPIDFLGGPAGLPTMQNSSSPAFNELTGGGTSLSTLTANAADAAAGRIVTGMVNGQLKNYQIRAGADAQALPGIVRLANFDEVTNAVVAVAC